MTTKYQARHDGVVVGTRTTKERTYTHAVVVQRVEEAARNSAYNFKPADHDRSNFDYYTAIATQGVAHEHVRPMPWRAEPDLKVLADATANIEGGFDAYVARLRAKAIADFEARKAKGSFDPFVAAWAGRLDLAHKAVAAHTGAWCKLIAIVEAEVVPAKPRKVSR